MYNKVEELNLPKNEEKVLEFWKNNDVKQKCLENNRGNKIFSFYEGPPTANGEPHAGHVLTRSLKDVFTRYKSMQGYFVPRKGGWDTHGLPVEISVEKTIGISGKQEIEAYGLEKFIEECKKDVWKYVDFWKTFSDRIAYNVDMENDVYVTYHDDYIESVWWSLKELDKKGLLYKGYKVMPCCPSCGTSLSSHELAQGYKQKKDTTVVAKFQLLNEKDTYFLAWTTTPWTLPSNVALCVNPNEEYVKISVKDEKYILAKALVKTHFKQDEYQIIQEYKGKDLEYVKYLPLFDFASEDVKNRAYFVTCDDYVTLTDGTGIVHIAPAYGEDDSKVGKKYDLPFLQMTDKFAKFTSDCGKYAGLNVFENNDLIAKDLFEEGKIFKEEKYVHEYPHCWRCSSPLIYFAREAWFVKTTKIQEKLIKNNQTINWLPPTIKNGRMGNWLENLVDWNLSRDRYWGTPLPVWMCECGHYHVVGSKEELRNLGELDKDIELHKPYVDEVKIKCPVCGKVMKREPYVIDCWYDSGSMPFAQHHYPFENKEKFEKTFPADYIGEGADQCRGWFYTLQVLGTALFGKAPFKNCLVNGMLVDEKGIKLSKSLKNYRPPMEIITEAGADPVRWSFYTGTQPWNNQVMTVATAKDTIKNYFGTLWNTYAFFVLYADIDKFNPSQFKLEDCELSVMDKWILSEFNMLVKNVTEYLDAFNCTDSSRLMQKFVDTLSNWYIRRCRKRFWVGGFTEDKKSAYMTLWTVLTEFAKLSAPFTPFMSETLYQNLVRPFFNDAKISVHLESYPKPKDNFIDKKLSEDMNLTYAYTELGRSARNSFNLKIRQPLQKLYLTDAQNKTSLNEDFIKILKEELNVKEVEQNSDLSKFIDYSLKPQLKTLGPKYGKLLGAIRSNLENCNANQVVAKVRAGEKYSFIVGEERVELSEDDLLINVLQKEGFASASEGGLAVVFDAHLTKELVDEGLVREFVSKVQGLRKSSNFEVTDRIRIELDGDNEIVDTLLKFKESISQDVLAVEFKRGNIGDFSEELDLNAKVTVYISKK